MQIGSTEREFLRLAFSSPEPVDLYELHLRFSLSPGQVARLIRTFGEAELVGSDGESAWLTDAGRRWVLQHRAFLFLRPSGRRWAKVPDAIVRPRADPNQPYLPRWKSLRKSFFLRG